MPDFTPNPNVFEARVDLRSHLRRRTGTGAGFDRLPFKSGSPPSEAFEHFEAIDSQQGDADCF
jgi:hypothetical protein